MDVAPSLDGYLSKQLTDLPSWTAIVIAIFAWFWSVTATGRASHEQGEHT